MIHWILGIDLVTLPVAFEHFGQWGEDPVGKWFGQQTAWYIGMRT